VKAESMQDQTSKRQSIIMAVTLSLRGLKGAGPIVGVMHQGAVCPVLPMLPMTPLLLLPLTLVVCTTVLPITCCVCARIRG
jgi:hypothetical protein